MRDTCPHDMNMLLISRFYRFQFFFYFSCFVLPCDDHFTADIAQTLRRTYVRRNLKYSSIFLDLFLSISFSKKVNYLSNFRLTLSEIMKSYHNPLQARQD